MLLFSWLLTHVVLLLGFLPAIPVIVQMLHQQHSPAGSLAVIGSANFDMRSLFLNYETGLLVYSQTEIEKIDKWIGTLACDCNFNSSGFECLTVILTRIKTRRLWNFTHRNQDCGHMQRNVSIRIS